MPATIEVTLDDGKHYRQLLDRFLLRRFPE
jgi:hypothetical protein